MTPYPLAWPEQIPRSKGSASNPFRTTLAGAINNVNDSLRKFGADSGKAVSDVVVSSNVTLGQNNPADPGVAVWFKWDGLSVCIPVDRYSKVEANLQAIHHIVEARRTELRHGTLALVRATFTGFISLPPHPGSKPVRPWREVFGWQDGLEVTKGTVTVVYKALAKERHPDAGGSTEAMAELNKAKTEALKEAEQ